MAGAKAFRFSRGRLVLLAIAMSVIFALVLVFWRLGHLSIAAHNNNSRIGGLRATTAEGAGLFGWGGKTKTQRHSSWFSGAADDEVTLASGLDNKHPRREEILQRAGSHSKPRSLLSSSTTPPNHAETPQGNPSLPFESAMRIAAGEVEPERYLVDALFGNGGNAFFESVVSGGIPFHPNEVVNAVVWGDTKPNPIQRRTIERPFKTVHFTYSDAELLSMHHDVDLVVSWVNGSAANHRWRKYAFDNFPDELRPRRNGGWFPTQVEINPRNASHKTEWQLNKLHILEAYLAQSGEGGRLMSMMDREHDELRYLLRSLHKNMDWHCGRIMIVSPGQTPTWLNKPRNFFMRSGTAAQSIPQKQQPNEDFGSTLYECRNSVARRIVIVHQDAVIPSAVRLTFNTNTIEAYLHRIRGLSNLYIHLNDDYMMYRKTNVTDFVNPRGGPVLNLEASRMMGSLGQTRIANKNVWEGSVVHTNGFIEEVFAHGVNNDIDEFRRAAERAYDSGRRAGSSFRRPVFLGEDIARWDSNGDQEPDVHFAVSDLRNPPDTAWPRPRYFLKHAPFVVCKNLYKRHLHRYYGHRFSTAEIEHKYRDVQDYVPPQIHNAFVTDVPWAASPKYKPHHMPMSMRRAADAEALAGATAAAAAGVVEDDASLGRFTSRSDAERLLEQSSSSSSQPPTTIYLDNSDGCAPAQLRIGASAEGHVIPLTNDMNNNKRLFGLVENLRPKFLTINDNGYDSHNVEDLLFNFTGRAFPFPSVAEHPDSMFYGIQQPHLLLKANGLKPLSQEEKLTRVGFGHLHQTALDSGGVGWRNSPQLGGELREAVSTILGSGEAKLDEDARRRDRWALKQPLGLIPDAQREILGLVDDDEKKDQKEAPTPLYTVLPQEQIYYERRYSYFNKLPLLISVLPDVDELVICALLRSIRHLALPDFTGNVFVYRENTANVAMGVTAQGSTPYEFRPVLLCTEYNKTRVEFLPPSTTAADINRRVVLHRPQPWEAAKTRAEEAEDAFLKSIDALVIRIPCNSVLGQSLALEDFSVKYFAGGTKGLFLQAPCPVAPNAPQQNTGRVNWVHGPTPRVLLQSFPLPERFYEPNDALTYGY